MGLVQYLHEPRVLLSVNQLQILVHVVLFQRLDSRHLLLVDLGDLLLILLLEVGLCQLNDFLLLGATFLVERFKCFLVFENLFQEFFASGSSAYFLARPHLLFKAFDRLGFLL